MLCQFSPVVSNNVEYRYFSRYCIEGRNSSSVHDSLFGNNIYFIFSPISLLCRIDARFCSWSTYWLVIVNYGSHKAFLKEWNDCTEL